MIKVNVLSDMLGILMMRLKAEKDFFSPMMNL